MARKKPRDLVALQKQANEYARDVFANVNFKLVDLSEEEFKARADTILRSLVTAWAAGFKAGRES